ncbi:MAG: Ig-like domain-containing protein [Balneolaceae bacterium]|nr:Ig-like domain-containing protein [Balneolaceae bacterium]
MQQHKYFPLFLLISFALIYCATPVGPTGGPRDEKGPEILFTEPESGTTNFTGDEVLIYFDEFVNRNSINNNITIEPDFGATFSTDWKRKRLAIKFEDRLPDSTTIIVTLGGQVSDTKGNRIGSSTVIAFSTGDEIDQGVINGRIRNAETGEGEESRKVALYRAPFDLKAPYNYVAETDTGGYFRFSYLREGTYKAIYFDDRNRNKIWNSDNETANPFRVDQISLAKGDTISIGEMYIALRDTVAPKIQGVGLFSTQRLRLRFNEEVALTDSTNIAITDTSGALFSEANALYVQPEERFAVIAQSDSALPAEQEYEVSISGLVDLASNQLKAGTFRFTGSDQPDTTLQRIVEIETDVGLFPTQPFVIRYAANIDSRTLFDSLVVVEGDVSFDDWPELAFVHNRLFVSPQGEWIDGIDYQFLVWNPATQRRALYTPEIWDNTELGELEIVVSDSANVADSASSNLYFYTLENGQNELVYSGSFSEVATINDLPPLTYILRIFKDENGDGIWNKGSVRPFQAPEPYIVRRSVNIQTGFTSQITIDFNE